jgi:translation initiation factor IF-2
VVKEGTVNLILKADVSGSLEALAQVIKALPHREGQAIEIINEGVGDITDGDIKMAASTKSIIVGFKTSASKAAETLARAQNVKIVQSEIIYDLVKAIEETLASLGKKIAKGKLEILATFGKKAGHQIIGGEVKEGFISNNASLEIERKGKPEGTGKIINLQSMKKDVKSVASGSQCGLIFDSETEINTGAILIAR